MKTVLLATVITVVALGLTATAADAARFGGGKSSGMQRNMPARTAPDATPPKPATPTQASPANTATAPAAGTAAAAAGAKRSWMGPIAGLAAGLGIAALMSHLGLGEAFGNFLMIALLAVAAIFIVRMIMRRRAGPATGMQFAGASAGAGAPGAGTGSGASWPAAGEPQGAAATSVPTQTLAQAPALAEAQPEPVATPAEAKAFVPASFDSAGFERVAKMIFIRMQAASDIGDLDDLRSFTTPEMFAMARLDLQERGEKPQRTDVVRVDAQVLDVAHEAERQIVSVRFHGQLREDTGGPLVDFDEIWHLTKPADDSRSWAIAGIEQKH